MKVKAGEQSMGTYTSQPSNDWLIYYPMPAGVIAADYCE